MNKKLLSLLAFSSGIISNMALSEEYRESWWLSESNLPLIVSTNGKAMAAYYGEPLIHFFFSPEKCDQNMKPSTVNVQIYDQLGVLGYGCSLDNRVAYFAVGERTQRIIYDSLVSGHGIHLIFQDGSDFYFTSKGFAEVKAVGDARP